MRIAGRTTVGSTQYEIVADTKRVARFNLPEAANISKGTMYLDGLGSGALGPQVCRQVIYDAAGNLVAVSDEVTVALGQAAGWVDFLYSSKKGKLALPRGDFQAGIFAGAYTNTIRVYGSGPHGMGGKQNSDTYSDGASATFGAASTLTSDLSCFLSYFLPYAPPANETDLFYSRLPHPEAQLALGAAGAEPESARLVSVGWHDTFIDPEVGANVLVRDGSDFVDLLGQRIKLTTQQVPVARSVVAYVHNLADTDAFDWDVSLTRHLFAQLGMLASDTIPVIVEVLA